MMSLEPQLLIFEDAVNFFQMHFETTALVKSSYKGGCCGIRAIKAFCLVQRNKIINGKSLTCLCTDYLYGAHLNC